MWRPPMSRKLLSATDVPEPLLGKLIAARYIYTADLQGVTPVELAKDIGVTHVQANNILKAAESSAVAILSSSTSLERCAVRPQIPTGCHAIDAALGGGVTVGEVIEVRDPQALVEPSRAYLVIFRV